nr:MAG TPA: hypothetical protein [Caudoviricetes sp.]
MKEERETLITFPFCIFSHLDVSLLFRILVYKK